MANSYAACAKQPANVERVIFASGSDSGGIKANLVG